MGKLGVNPYNAILESREKFNPNHDELGRFAESPGGGDGGTTSGRYAAGLPEVTTEAQGKWRERILNAPGKDALIASRAKYVGMTPDKYLQTAQDNLDRVMEHASVWIRADATTLDAVLTDGYFKSQFETGKSRGGTLDLDRRADFEDKTLGVSKTTKPENRPIYGILSATDDGRLTSTDLENRGGLDQYGMISIKFKDSIRDRTSFTQGDSLESEGFLLPSKVTKPSIYSTGIAGIAGRDVLNAKTVDDLDARYTEAQILGGVRVKDIEKIAFAKPPTRALKAKLELAKIPYKVVELPKGRLTRI